jgi:alpha-mannosidase
MAALQQSPDRKFTYVEIAFFWRWWSQQDEEMQALVKSFVQSQQLHFANGGWVMHDEANPVYADQVESTMLGHRFLMETFGYAPKANWQIDPFGHSGTQASLLTATAGFQSLFFARSHYDDYSRRANESNLEFYWQSSPSLGAAASVFTGIFYGADYSPPAFLDTDFNSILAIPIVDDPALEDYNVPWVVEWFIENAMLQANSILGDDIMFLLGMDFEFRGALINFKQLDKLIKYVNADGRVNAVYSTPDMYAAAKLATPSLYKSTVNSDFMPYADMDHAYWTGYFTSRPALKGYVRVVSALARAAVQLQSWTGNYSSIGYASDPLFRIREAVAVAQHHDAVAGTSKQTVAFDYAKRLARGWNEAVPPAASALTQLLQAPESIGAISLCPLANITICPALESGLVQALVIYNTQGQIRAGIPVRLPVLLSNGTATLSYSVSNATGAAIASEITAASALDMQLRQNAGGDASSMGWLAFTATVPPTGYTTVFIQPIAQESTILQPEVLRPSTRNTRGSQSDAGGTFSISNNITQLIFSNDTGRLISARSVTSGLLVNLVHELAYYGSNHGDWVNLQPSGAYIFRPNVSTSYAIAANSVQTEVLPGKIVQEVRQTYANWAQVVFRLYPGNPTVEVEYTVGPIPIDDNWGKEVISRFNSSLASNGTFATDSNGREFYNRTRDTFPWGGTPDELIAGNFYPVNTAIQINDAARRAGLAVSPDRSHSGSSLVDGSLELMVHRRLLMDDLRGVFEALNETDPATQEGLIVRGKHHLLLQPTASMPQALRTVMQDAMFAPQYMFVQPLTPMGPFISSHVLNWQALANQLPPNVHLLTGEFIANSTLLLRLAHLYQVGEGVLAQNVSVALPALFRDFTIATAAETTLTANAALSSPVVNAPWPQSITTNAPPAATVTLSAMQVRTFLCTTTGSSTY